LTEKVILFSSVFFFRLARNKSGETEQDGSW